MFLEFKSYAFFHGLCDATFSKMWGQGTLGMMLKKSRCDS